MAGATASFSYNIDVSASSAETAAKELKKLQDQMRAGSAEVRQLQAAMKALGATGVSDASVGQKLNNQLQAQKKALSDLASSYAHLKTAAKGAPAGGAAPASPAAAKGGEGGGMFGAVLSANLVGGAIGAIPGLAKEALSAVMGLAESFAHLGLEVTKFALATADEKRALLLQTEALLGSKDAARELLDQIDELSATGLVSEEQMTRVGRSLAGAGLKGDQLSDALRNVATVAGVMGDEAGSKIESLYQRLEIGHGKFKLAAKQLKDTGLESALKPGIVTAEKLGAAIKGRFGDVAGRAALGFSAQMKGLKHNIGELFEDINIEPFLNALHEVTSLFDQQTTTGQALKTLVEGLFNPLFAALGNVGPGKDFFKTLIIWAQRTEIALLGVVIWARNIVRSMSGLDPTIMFVLEAAAIGLAVAIGVVAAALAFVVGITALAIGAFVGLVAAIGFAIARAAFMAYQFYQVGSEFVTSLVSGIQSGVGGLVTAVTEMAQKAVTAIKQKLKISSPSKVFQEIGLNLTQGVARGVKGGTPDVAAATSAMVRPEGVAGGRGAARGGSTFNVTITGVENADHLLTSSFQAQLATAFERAATVAGVELG